MHRGHFWEVADKLPLSDSPLSEDNEEDESSQYLTLFDGRSKEKDVYKTPCLALWKRVEKGYLPRANVRLNERTDQINLQGLLPEGVGTPGGFKEVA